MSSLPTPSVSAAPSLIPGDWVTQVQTMTDQIFGSSAESITCWQTSLRAIVIFLYGILIFRFAYRRIFGQSTNFDIVVVVLLGSTLSRALTGNSQMLPTFAATTLLVVLHAAVARLAFRWHVFGWLIKGAEIRLVDGGRMMWREMRRAGITERDLLEAARQEGAGDLSQIKAAILERSGRISVILRPGGGAPS